MATKLFGQYIETGSIPTTALSGGVVSSSLQIVASLPTGSLSSSAQVNYTELQNIPTAIVSSSAQVTAFLPVGTVSSSTQLPDGIASSSAQVKDYLPTDTVSSSVQVTAFLPVGTVSSSTQLPSGIASSSAQVTDYLPNGTVSSSGQVNVFTTIGGDSLATTGSNTFTAPQIISDTTNSTSYLDGALHIAGGMSVQKDMRISGSMTINGLLSVVSMSSQYVTSSQYNIGVSKITLNDDDNVRFAGMSIYDSGSSSPTSASIFWDSLNHKFIYENLSGSAYNSAILMAGPKNTGSLGDEVGLTTGYIPYATGDDHIDNSVIYQTGSNIGIGTTTPSVTLVIASGSQTTLDIQATSTGGTARLKLNPVNNNFYAIETNGSTDALQFIRGSSELFRINSSGNVGIGTTDPAARLGIQGTAGSGVDGGVLIDLYGGTISSVDNGVGISFTRAGSQMAYIQAARESASTEAAYLRFATQTSAGAHPESMRITSTGNVGIGTTNPGSYKLQVQGNTRVVGTLETADLQLSNEQLGPNSIDGTTGKWLIQEGQDDLYIINQLNGKKFKFNLIEV